MTLRYDVNLSILFTELPLLQRPQAARDAGFEAVEVWWPFTAAVPADREVDAFSAAVRDAGVQLVSLNAYGGDLAAGERGIASLPGREVEFGDNLDVAVGLLEALACPTLHVLHGHRDGSDPARQDELATAHLRLAVARTAQIGAGVVVEALSGDERYPVRTAADAIGVLDRVPGARFLCDVYHLSVNGEHPVEAIRRHADRIGHVQVADAPGRHQPGTGTVDVAGCLAALEDVGYDGWVGLEYAPLGPSSESFDWLLHHPPAPGR